MALPTNPVYRRYVIETKLFALVGVLCALLALWTAWNARIVVTVVLLAMVFVCFDNVFCGDRCRVAGVKKTGHYVIPPFIKQ